MNYLPEFLVVVGVHLLAIMSPGPDFLLITRNSLVYSRKVGIYSSTGLGLGILVHVTYSLVGIGLIISKSIVLFSILKYLGAAYLIYIGIKSLRAQRAADVAQTLDGPMKVMTPWQAVRTGFLTNVLNPKVSLFFFALFTQVVQPTTPKFIQALYGLEMSLMTVVWFGLVATLLSHSWIKNRFSHIQHHLERFFGACLILLGIKVAFSK